MKESEPIWLGETRSKAGALNKNIDYYAGHVPKDKFPQGSRVIYTRGLSGLETEVHTTTITPVAVITVYEGKKPTR